MSNNRPMSDVAVQLHPLDSVVVVTETLSKGVDLAGDFGVLTLLDEVPAGHKLALRTLFAGEQVIKYGEVFGVASKTVPAGSHVHTHNLEFVDVVLDYDIGGAAAAAAAAPPPPGALHTFDGIRRPGGGVGTRNYIGILTSVNCSATAARLIADQFRAGSPELAEYPHVDGVVALTHGSGCGMASSGPGFELLSRTLSGYARHPNFAGLVVLGLGCEVNQVAALPESFALPDDTPVHYMTIQELGGMRATVREGVARVRELLQSAGQVRRTPVPASELVLGLQCGGSDGWSGITANPALGVAADILTQQGGTAILGETPEVYGAEHLLTRRAVSADVGERLLERIRWWERYTSENGGSMDNNPSPGNKAGGLTTILEKSLGAIAKGGAGPLTAVYEYAERVSSSGLVFMDTPGYDPVSATGMVAGGANMICFTTGRGSVYGCKPTPSIKLATNTAMYRRMEDDMDLDCGRILGGGSTVTSMGSEIFELILDVASGRLTKSEENGLGDLEFAPWQLGAVM
jgi:altronate hydrolase